MQQPCAFLAEAEAPTPDLGVSVASDIVAPTTCCHLSCLAKES